MLRVWFGSFLIIQGAIATHAAAEILVGLAAPLSGQQGWIGEPVQRGVELAVQDLNANGGLLGQDLRVIAVDDFCDGEQAVAAAKKLIAEDVAVIIGHQCSGAAIPASELYEKEKIILISPFATNPLVTERGLQYVFRVCGRDDQQGVIAGDRLVDRWSDKKIAIIHDGDIYGKGLADVVKRQLESRGIAESLFVQIEPGKAGYGEVVDELARNEIDAVYYAGYAPEAALILRQSQEAGLSIQLFSGDALSPEDFWLVAGEAADGAMFTLTPDPRGDLAAADLVERLRESGLEPTSGTFNGYAALQAWIQAVMQVSTTNPDVVAKTLRNSIFDTVLGPLGFDNKGDVTGIETFVWHIWENGSYRRLDQAELTD